jgi:hypothetical protein
MSNSPIFSFQPRPGYEISQWALNALKNLEVEHISESLNTKYPEYPQGNKPFAGAYAEDQLPYDNFIFLDSDKLVVNDLSDAVKLETFDIAVRPTHGKGVACVNLDDPNIKYWSEIWHDLGIVEPAIRVVTTVGREDVYGYWNSGLLVVKRRSGILSQWRNTLEMIRDKPIEPASSTFFLDQIALAVVLHSRPSKVKTLPPGYNYPIHRHFLKEMPKDRMLTHMNELYTVHYHGLIRDPFFINMFDGFEESIEIKKWFFEQIQRYKVEPHHRLFKRSYLQLRMALYRTLKRHNLR